MNFIIPIWIGTNVTIQAPTNKNHLWCWYVSCHTEHLIPETVFLLASALLPIWGTDARQWSKTFKHYTFIHSLYINNFVHPFSQNEYPDPVLPSLQLCHQILYFDIPFPVTLAPDPFHLVSWTQLLLNIVEKLYFCASQGSAAMICWWGWHIYIFQMLGFLGYCVPKLLKLVDFW